MLIQCLEDHKCANLDFSKQYHKPARFLSKENRGMATEQIYLLVFSCEVKLTSNKYHVSKCQGGNLLFRN